MSWNSYAKFLTETLPKGKTTNCTHETFSHIFRSSRLASLPRVTEEKPNYEQRSSQKYPKHQVITTPSSSLRRGDWGLKRPLPPIKSPYIVLFGLDTYESQTPYNIAVEKVRFVLNMRAANITLTPSLNVSNEEESVQLMKSVTRPPPNLWSRNSGGEKGPWLLKLDSKQFDKYLRHIKLTKRSEYQKLRSILRASDTPPTDERTLIFAYLDIPIKEVPYSLHPTGGLVYSPEHSTIGVDAKGYYKYPPAQPGRLIRAEPRGGETKNLVAFGGIYAAYTTGSAVIANRENISLLSPTLDSSPFNRDGTLNLRIIEESDAAERLTQTSRFSAGQTKSHLRQSRAKDHYQDMRQKLVNERRPPTKRGPESTFVSRYASINLGRKS